MTRFAWQEEVLACVNKLVPYSAEQEVKKRGARQSCRLSPTAWSMATW